MTKTITKLGLGVLLLSITALSGCSQPDNTQLIRVEASEQITEALQARIQGDASGACLAAAHVSRTATGALQSERGFYCAASDEHEAITLPNEHSRYEIGSVSKVMLGGIIAQLQAEGVLHLEQTLTEWAPEGIEVPQVGEQPILLRHMLTHTSGLPRLPILLAPENVNDPYADFTTEALWQSLAQAELEGEPGQQFGYSNFAYMLLSMIASEASGKPLDELYTQYLYEPLGMNTASFIGETMQPRSADGKPVVNWNFPMNMQGVGGVRASIADMEVWLAAQLGARPEWLASALAASHEPLEQVAEGKYGWGWMYATVGEREYLMHGGGTIGFTTVVVVDLEMQTASVVLSNAALYQTGDIQRLGLHLLDANIPPGTPYIPEVMPSSVDLADYEGSYPLMPGFAIRVFAEDVKLMIQGTGQPAAEVFYKADDVFENAMFGARFVFERNEEGEVIALTLYQAGQELRGEREAP